jgi:hypothetical protein
MRLVQLTAPGRVEINFLWLPTWLGINKAAKESIEAELKDSVVGRTATEDTLDLVNDEVIDLLAKRYPTIEGLRDYLDGLKFIRI